MPIWARFTSGRTFQDETSTTKFGTKSKPPFKKGGFGMEREFLSIRSVKKTFGHKKSERKTILNNLSLEIKQGEFLTILGESGSGKTTFLRLMGGFETVDAGEIWLDGLRIDLLPPYRRPVNTVFQQYALFPHMSVFENVAYGLRIARKGQPKKS